MSLTIDDKEDYLITQGAVFRKCWKSVYAIKLGIEEGDLESAAEAYFELSNAEKAGLSVAPTKGGLFTTQERAVIKSSEFRQSYFGEEI